MSPVSPCETASSPAATITRLVVGGSIVSTEGKDSSFSLSPREIIPRRGRGRRRPLPDLDLVERCVSSLCRATRLERNVRPRSSSLTVESVFLRLIRLNTATHRLELTLHARQLPHCRFYYPVRLPLSGYDSLVYDLTKEKKKKCNSALVSTIENPWMNYPTFPLPRVENRNRVEFISAKIYLLGLYIFGRKGNCRYEDRTNAGARPEYIRPGFVLSPARLRIHRVR